jgi:hypothetical protein
MFWIRCKARRWLENVQMFAAWLAPRWLVRWCGVRMGAHATTGRFGDQVVPELTMMDALTRWEDRAGGDRAHRIRWGFVAAMALLLGALLSVSSCGGEAAAAELLRPRHKGANPLEVRLAGDTVAASWIWKAPLRSVDTGVVRFRQKPSGASTWSVVGSNIRTRGTSASREIARAEAGDSVEVCVWVVTVGASPSPQMCQKRGRGVEPHPGADSLEVSSVIVRPDSARAYAMREGQTVPADSNQIQFCAGVRLSDDRVILTSTSDSVAVCPGMFAAVPGYTSSIGAARVRVPLEGIQVTIEAGEPLAEVDARGEPVNVWREIRPHVAGAVKFGGEWWLRKPVKLPAVS